MSAEQREQPEIRREPPAPSMRELLDSCAAAKAVSTPPAVRPASPEAPAAADRERAAA